MLNKPTPPTNVHTAPGSAGTETPTVTAKFNQDDPILRQKVEAFVQDAGGRPADKTPVEVKPNDDFNLPNPNDTMLTEALINTEQQDVTDTEKAVFVKALLNDEPVRFSVSLYDGKFVVDLRSRSLHEQRRIFDVLEKDHKDKLVDVNDMAYFVTRLQQYCMAIMVERVNGKSFSEISIPSSMTLDDTQALLHKAVAAHVEGVQGIRWTSLNNALRIFEAKCAKMNTEAANQDFWKPRGSG
jgi:hypothetical protein